MSTDPPAAGRPIAGLPGNVFWLGLVSFFNDLGSEMVFPVLPLFLTSALGASMAVVGLIDGVAESVSSLTKVWAGALSDRFRRRRPLVAAGYAASNTAQPLIGLTSHWGAVVPLRFLDRMGKGLRTAPRDAIIADAVTASSRGWAYGFHRAMDSAGGVLGPLLAFTMLATFALARGDPLTRLFSPAPTAPATDYRWVILASAVPSIVAVCLVFLVRERPRPAAVLAAPTLMPPKGPFRMLLVATTLFSLGNISYSFIVLRSRDIGVSPLLLPLLYLFFHLGQTLFAGPLGVLSDYIGRKSVVGAGYALFALMSVGWALADRPSHAVALAAFYGLSLACTEGGVRAWAVDLVPPERRGGALGALHGLTGLAALPASLVAGILWTARGPTAAFAWAAALASSATLWLLIVPGTLTKAPPRGPGRASCA